MSKINSLQTDSCTLQTQWGCKTYTIEHHICSLFSSESGRIITSDNLTRYRRKPGYLILYRDAEMLRWNILFRPAILFLSFSLPLLLLRLLLPGAGCICTMGVDGVGGWGRAEHGNHLKVGWLLWRPAAAQWQQRGLIELHRGGESCRAVESTEDYAHAVTHTHTHNTVWLTIPVKTISRINPLTWLLTLTPA